MAVREILSALGRRWYIVFVGVALTLVGGWYVYSDSPAEYSARGLVLLLPSPGVEEPAGANPFLDLGGLELPARVLVATYSSTSFLEELAEQSPTAEVEVMIDESARGPIIVVAAHDVGAERTLDTLAYVMGTVSERLDALQAEVGVEATAVVRSMVLTVDTEAEPEYQSLIRALVLVIGGGFAVTLALALSVDVALERRARRRRGFGAHRRWVTKGRHGGRESFDDEDVAHEGVDTPSVNTESAISAEQTTPGPRAATRDNRPL